MDDQELVALLKAGDEAAFRGLVAEYHGRLARLARSFSRNDSVIEEAVQETWLAVIRGIGGFEGRGPLRSWMFSILANQARKLAVREQRHWQTAHGLEPRNASAQGETGEDDLEPGMGANGMWRNPPTPWGLQDPESYMLSMEAHGIIDRAFEGMPEAQRRVVLLRDVEGLNSEEVCNILGLSGTNERVLLHRGRARVRRALDSYMKEGALEPRPEKPEKARIP